MKHVIYYFSGTGNSYSIAKELSKLLEDCNLIPIAKIWKDYQIKALSENVGIVFPLYYWGLPHIIYEFISKLNFENVKYIYAVITRAGDDDGIPLIQFEQILNKKSKKLNAGFFIQMPNNYILGFDVDPEDYNQALFKQAKLKVGEIFDYIKENKNNIKPEKLKSSNTRTENMNKGFRENVLNSDKEFYADEKCTSCRVCEQICPVSNIRIVENKPEWLHHCQQCLACINYCPEKAIQYNGKTLSFGRYHHPKINIEDISQQQGNK